MKKSRSRCYDCCQSQLARNSPSFQVLTLQNIKKWVHRVLELVMQTLDASTDSHLGGDGYDIFSFVQYFSQIIMVKKGSNFHILISLVFIFSQIFLFYASIYLYLLHQLCIMREFGLHNPLVCEASSDQDKPGVCVEMELSAPVLC